SARGKAGRREAHRGEGRGNARAALAQGCLTPVRRSSSNCAPLRAVERERRTTFFGGSTNERDEKPKPAGRPARFNA
ncbi:hypothetical protein, partial [Burkholderia oklahomensis]|uniref:hypothetical protein n=1 Tax=Burkholderia oklahomensis TaxID=342113 RepID=UPI00016A6341